MSESNTSESSHLDGLRQLRDEIRLKVHLAALDTRQKWDELEQKLEAFEQRVVPGGNIVGATDQLAHDLRQSLVDFRRRLAQ